MDQFESYTLEEAINHETGFTRSQPREYYKLIDNIHRVGNLISYSKLELKRVLMHATQIYELPQGGKSSLKFMMIYCAEEAKLGYRNESSYI